MDGRNSATLILMKISHFDRTALYLFKAPFYGDVQSALNQESILLCKLLAQITMCHYSLPCLVPRRQLRWRSSYGGTVCCRPGKKCSKLESPSCDRYRWSFLVHTAWRLHTNDSNNLISNDYFSGSVLWREGSLSVACPDLPFEMMVLETRHVQYQRGRGGIISEFFVQVYFFRTPVDQGDRSPIPVW